MSQHFWEPCCLHRKGSSDCRIWTLFSHTQITPADGGSNFICKHASTTHGHTVKKQHIRININKKLLWKLKISYNSLTLHKQKLCVQHHNFTLSCSSSTYLLFSHPINLTYNLTPLPELHNDQAFLEIHLVFIVHIISHCCRRHHHHLHWFWNWILGCWVSKLSDNESNWTEMNYYCTSRK